jgi:SAM-dependent methyltransferase
MSHWAQHEFVDIISHYLPSFFNRARVLEVGSLDINGSVRDLFQGCDYSGIDVGPGKGVDIVCQGQEFDAPAFDQVISCEAMEHNPYWAETFHNMVRLCRPGGLVVMTCATTGRPEHGTRRTSPQNSPLTTQIGWDYYRNLTARDFRRLSLDTTFSKYQFWSNWTTFDLMFCGIRTGAPAPAEWHALVRRLDLAIGSANTSRTNRYRALAARLLGNGWFNAVRPLTSSTKYNRLHTPIDGRAWD